MKQINLTKLGVRIVEAGISARSEAFTPRENSKWLRIKDKILGAILEYDEAAQALLDESEDLGRQVGITRDERDEAIRSINAAMYELDEGPGQDAVTIDLEDEEYSFVSSNFANAKFGGERKLARRVEAISVALEAANDVAVVDGKLVPVEKAKNGRPKWRGARR